MDLNDFTNFLNHLAQGSEHRRWIYIFPHSADIYASFDHETNEYIYFWECKLSDGRFHRTSRGYKTVEERDEAINNTTDEQVIIWAKSQGA